MSVNLCISKFKYVTDYIISPKTESTLQFYFTKLIN